MRPFIILHSQVLQRKRVSQSLSKVSDFVDFDFLPLLVGVPYACESCKGGLVSIAIRILSSIYSPTLLHFHHFGFPSIFQSISDYSGGNITLRIGPLNHNTDNAKLSRVLTL